MDKLGKQITGLASTFTFACGVPVSAKAEDAYIRVVDVGNAMCVIIKIPGNHYMLYDAGDLTGSECTKAVDEIIGKNQIDLVILSHSDSDHVGEIPKIFKPGNGRTVGKLVYTGRPGTAKVHWPKVVASLEALEKDARAKGQNPIRNLGIEPLPNTLTLQKPPLTIKLGEATVTFVAGWKEWPYGNETGASLSAAEKNNVVSIVAKFTYAGKSVLLTGDTIGRIGDDKDPNACRYAEKWMIEKSNVTIKSDILIGQHHGGDNSSASCFIKAVNPDYVVLPAGTESHIHPRATTAERILAAIPIQKDHIFRTDRGDDQGKKEWDYLREENCDEKPGDDDIEFIISADRGIEARYQTGSVACKVKQDKKQDQDSRSPAP